MKRVFCLIFIVLCTVMLISCSNGGGNIKEEDILIGVVYPVELVDGSTHFIKGVNLALEQINSAGGVLGKYLTAVVRDDNDEILLASEIAQTMCDIGVSAVIGHWSSRVTYVVEDIYEKNNIVMITPSATSFSIFEWEYEYIFRMIPNCGIYAASIAEDMALNGYKRVVFFYANSVYGRAFANALEKELTLRDIMVVDRVTDITHININMLTKRWDAFGCEALAFLDSYDKVTDALRLVRDSSKDYAFYGAEDIERLDILDELGEYAAGLKYTPYDKTELDPDFYNAFVSKYGVEPDSFAIIGYDTVTLLKNAMEAVNSSKPDAIAGYINNLEDYQTLQTTLSFNKNTREFEGFKININSY